MSDYGVRARTDSTGRRVMLFGREDIKTQGLQQSMLERADCPKTRWAVTTGRLGQLHAVKYGAGFIVGDIKRKGYHPNCKVIVRESLTGRKIYAITVPSKGLKWVQIGNRYTVTRVSKTEIDHELQQEEEK